MDEKSRLDRKRLFWRNICELLRLYPVKGANHEQDRIMAFKSAHRWSEIHLSSAAYGRWSVFWEGLLKICIPKSRTGPLHKIGNAFPTLHATFVGCLEIFGGMLLLSGLMTRLIALPFVAEMIVAILSTKISKLEPRSGRMKIAPDVSPRIAREKTIPPCRRRLPQSVARRQLHPAPLRLINC